ncbi:hypothetical protein ABZ312_09665 [Streptomyces sp. NPDC006207]
MTRTGRIATRVGIDDLLGPFEAQVDPAHRWNGFLHPHFALDAVRQLAARTQEVAAQLGRDAYDTVHVIDGGTDSEGQPRAVVLIVSWRYFDEGPEAVTDIVQPDSRGLYDIGGGSWAWSFAGWWCACGFDQDWHETQCGNCDLTRDTQPAKKPCDCGCDPSQGALGDYDLDSEASRAHFAATGRYLRWTESAQPCA